MTKLRARIAAFGTPFALATLLCSASWAAAPNSVSAGLEGLQVKPPVLTQGSGDFEANIDSAGQAFTYTLSYSGLGSIVTQVHVRIGAKGTNGGVAVILCTNLDDGLDGTPACPEDGGTIEGTVDWSDVLDLPSQGIAEGDIDKVLDAVDSGIAYVNVMSSMHPRGEIRGQIGRR